MLCAEDTGEGGGGEDEEGEVIGVYYFKASNVKYTLQIFNEIYVRKKLSGII